MVVAALMVIPCICASVGQFIVSSRIMFEHLLIKTLFYYKLPFFYFFFILELRHYIIFEKNIVADSTIHEFYFRMFNRMSLNIWNTKRVLD